VEKAGTGLTHKTTKRPDPNYSEKVAEHSGRSSDRCLKIEEVVPNHPKEHGGMAGSLHMVFW
jgi:hypothetical protein